MEHATKLFAEIQSAYEVLSDAQERAWYDSHRNVFLGGSQPGQNDRHEFFYNMRMTTAEDVHKLMMRFNGLAYSKSTAGFYSGLREFFSHLAKEEETACKWENVDPVEYPSFGQEDDDYDDVVRPFYAAWKGFFTRKSYSWKDSYRLSDAPDRRVRRLMEKQNKGLRDEAIRDFNDAVRSLVAFVRKRDLRYQENQKSEEDRQKILREAAVAQSARSRAARQAKLNYLDRQTVPEWAKSTMVDEHEGRFSDDEDPKQHEIECVICNKSFKSEAQYETHEKSKKHIKRVKHLQREMRDQDQEIGDSESQTAAPNVVHQPSFGPGHEEDDHQDQIDENGVPPVRTDDGGLDHDKPRTFEPERPSGEASNSARDGSSTEGQSSHEEDDDCASKTEIEDRLTSPESNDLASQLKATALKDVTGASDSEAFSAPKLGKAKQKRAKRAAQKDVEAKDATSSDFQCVVCRAEFPSKSKLFVHIKDMGHAAPVSSTGSKGAKSRKGRET